MKPTDWRASNIPEDKWDARFDLIPSDLPFVGQVTAYRENMRENVERGRGLILWGPYRGGKTCISALLAEQAMAHRLNAYFIFSFDVADVWMARGWRKGEIRGCDFLILDDLGMESQDQNRGEFPREKIRDLLRVRLEGGRPTIITTNLSPDQVRKTYGEKMWALLDEKMMDVRVAGAEKYWKEKPWEQAT